MIKVWKRLVLILIVYVVLVSVALLSEHKIESQLSSKVFESPSISVQTYLDDFVRVIISCSWNEKEVTFIVHDEFGNIKHNSSSILTCSGNKIIDLQGEPQDYPLDRKYMVEVYFDNETINSGYFYFQNYNWLGLVQREAFSFEHFAIYENRLARGSYSDSQRMLFVATGDSSYGQNYLLSHLAGLIFAFVIFLSIDIAIWIIYFFTKSIKKSRKSLSWVGE